mgnify:CR=1 FL=1
MQGGFDDLFGGDQNTEEFSDDEAETNNMTQPVWDGALPESNLFVADGSVKSYDCNGARFTYVNVVEATFRSWMVRMMRVRNHSQNSLTHSFTSATRPIR